jgi:ABC-type spermidine/putrescine transport system permease subunit I
MAEAALPGSGPGRVSPQKVPSTAERGGAWFPRWFWPSFAAPATAYLLVFFVFPFYVILCVTFGTTNAITQVPVPVYSPARWNPAIFSFVWSNITHADGLYEATLIRTFVYVAIATSICILIGYPFAYFVARHAGRFRGLFLALFFAPFWISYMLRMLAWIGLLQDDGLVNKVLALVGIKPYSWLSGHVIVLILGLVYGYVPYMILPLFAALDRIPGSHIEASRDLGASPFGTFFRVVLPQSAQAILAGVVLCGLPMVGDYFTQQLLTNTRSTAMIGDAVVANLANNNQVSQGAALIVILTGILVIPIVYYLRSTGRAARERVG